MKGVKNMNEKNTDFKYSCVISGSFRKYYEEIIMVYNTFVEKGIEVISPKKSWILNPNEEFALLDADIKDSDIPPTIRSIEDNVLKKIHTCDFLYVYNPCGNIGTSTAFEIGFANALNKKIVTLYPPTDKMISKFIDAISSPDLIIGVLKKKEG